MPPESITIATIRGVPRSQIEDVQEQHMHLAEDAADKQPMSAYDDRRYEARKTRERLERERLDRNG